MDGLGTLNCVYFFLFALGVGYALVSWVLGGLASFELPGIDIDIPGVDLHPGEPDIHLELPLSHDVSADVDHPEVGLSPLSPITVAAFITTFGGVGLILHNLAALPVAAEIGVSAVSGLAVSGVVVLIYARVLAGLQSSSQVRSGEIVGKMAEVITPIEAGRLGEVSFVARGARVRGAARSHDGAPIGRGTRVEIIAESGNVVVVRPHTPGSD